MSSPLDHFPPLPPTWRDLEIHRLSESHAVVKLPNCEVVSTDPGVVEAVARVAWDDMVRRKHPHSAPHSECAASHADDAMYAWEEWGKEHKNE